MISISLYFYRAFLFGVYPSVYGAIMTGRIIRSPEVPRTSLSIFQSHSYNSVYV